MNEEEFAHKWYKKGFDKAIQIKDINDNELTTTTTESREKDLPSRADDLINQPESVQLLASAGVWINQAIYLSGLLGDDADRARAYCVDGITPKLIAYRISEKIPPETPLPKKKDSAQDILDKYTEHEFKDFFEK